MSEQNISKQELLLGVFAWRLRYLEQHQLSQAIKVAMAGNERSLEDVLLEMQLMDRQSLAIVKSLLESQQHQKESVVLTALGVDDETVESVLSSVNVADSVSELPPIETLVAVSAESGETDNPSALPLSVSLQKTGVHAEGGLGRIIKARDEFLGRDVAVKEIRPEIANDRVAQSRFVREAQITSRLQHPGIVPVHLSGRDKNGMPFYVMQLIQGQTMRELIQQFHRKRDRLVPGDYSSVKFRNLIDVLCDVAQTIRYAHSKNILHRDLKPQNVLVGEYGETLVIDWGLACDRSSDIEKSASDGANDVPSDATQQGQILGTIGYASPEQLSGRIDQVSQQSDVYALGAMLYEILIGRPPHLCAAGVDLKQAVASVLETRPQEPKLIHSSVPKSLSAIATKALQFETTARYTNVDAFLADLNHWKMDREISAAPDSVLEKLARIGRKYRHYAWLSALALFAISIIALAALFLVNQSRINETEAKDQANSLAIRNQNVVDAFVDAFESPNPVNDGTSASMSAADVLVQAKSRFELSEDFGGDELTQASILNALGRSLHALGKYSEAVVALQEAFSISESKLGSQHSLTLEYMDGLARALLSNGDHEKAVAMHNECYEMKKRLLGATHEQVLASKAQLAMAKEVVGDTDEAVAMLRETLEQQKAILDSEHEDIQTTMQNLAICLQSDGNLDEAIEYYLAALALRESTLGRNDPRTVELINNLAFCYEQAGQYDKARKMAMDALELREVKLGADHPHTLYSLGNLARVYEVDGQHKEAIDINEKLLDRLKIKLGSDHPKTLQIMNNLASTYQVDGRFEEAAEMMFKTMNLFREKLGPEHHKTYTCMSNLASIYGSLGRYEDAIEYYQQVLDYRVRELGKDHPSTLICMSNFAFTLESAGQFDKALPMYEEAYELFLSKLGPDHPNTVGAISNLASIYDAVGQLDKAMPLYEKTYAEMERVVGEDHPRTLIGGHALAVAYVRAKRTNEALPIFEKTLVKMQKVFGEDHFRTKECIKNNAIAYEKADRKKDAVKLYKQLVVLAGDDAKTKEKWQEAIDELTAVPQDDEGEKPSEADQSDDG